MTKEQFANYNGLLHCTSCGYDIPKEGIDHRRVHQDGTINRCKVCDWFYRNKDKDLKSFSQKDVFDFIRFYIYENGYYLNDIANKLNYSIDKIIELHLLLNMTNKEVAIKDTCEYCGNICEFKPKAYTLSKHHYCSHDCYYKDKTNKVSKGKDNISYNRIETNCTNCNKKIYVIPYNYNKKNQFGENNNFCSQQCYWEYRSKHYVGNFAPATNRIFTEEMRQKSRKICLENLKNMSTKNTSIQLMVDNWLNELNVKYEREYTIGYYSIDNYLTDYNLAIEVMGDYWHSNPLKYNLTKNKINQIQYKDIKKDKSKKTYLFKYHKINILYLWESDIKINPLLCKSLILYYIYNNGMVENYNSFNWYINKYDLVLNNKIIYPYFEVDKEITQKILKEVS